METASLGSTDRDTLARVEDEVRQIVQARTAELHQIAGRIVVTADQVHAAGAEPETARSLFEATAHAIDEQPAGRAAATIFNPTFTPIAWSGRPAELPRRSPRARPGIVRRARATRSASRVRHPGGRPVGTTARRQHCSRAAARRRRAVSFRNGRRRQAVDQARHRSQSVRAMKAPAESAPASDSPSAPQTAGHCSKAASIRPHWSRCEPAIEVPRRIWRSPHSVSRSSRRRFRSLDGGRRSAGPLTTCCLVHRPGTRSSPRDWLRRPRLPEAGGGAATGSETRWWWFLLLRSPADLLATAALLLAVAWLLSDAVERRRLVQRHPSRPYASVAAAAGFALTHVAAGCALALLLIGHRRLLALVYAGTSADPVQFSLHPFNVERVTFMVGVLLLHASVLWSAALLLRFVATLWRVGTQEWRLRALTALCWLAPVAVAAWVEEGRGVSWVTLLTPGGRGRHTGRTGAATWTAAAPWIAGDATQRAVPGARAAGPGVLSRDGRAVSADHRASDHRAARSSGALASAGAAGRMRRSLAQIDQFADLPGLLDTERTGILAKRHRAMPRLRCGGRPSSRGGG